MRTSLFTRLLIYERSGLSDEDEGIVKQTDPIYLNFQIYRSGGISRKLKVEDLSLELPK